MARANPWFKAGLDAMALGLEASTVIGLRTMRIAAGGAAADAEAKRMVAEKVDAALALHALALTGGLGWSAPRITSKTIAHYRRRVRANRRRLTKG
jgi:hypothetical protein